MTLAGPDSTEAVLPAPRGDCRPAPADPLDNPDPDLAADAAAAESLLRCWIREADLPRPDGDVLRLGLLATGVTVEIPVRYWSPAGWHRLGRPVAAATGATLDVVTLAALLAREAADDPAAGADTVARVADSVRRTAEHLRHRRAHPTDPQGTTPFLAAEQALLLGHPCHPTPKSRIRLTDAEAATYSPELRGSFALHWFAAAPDLVSERSALPLTAAEILRGLADGVDVPAGMLAIPAHPWQARQLTYRPEIAALLRTGMLRDLGPGGPHWSPTSSVRTVYRPDAPVMLKLSLGLQITNSKRENLRKELIRGLEVHRLMESGLQDELREAHPGFDILRDPAWITVDAPPEEADPGRTESGFELMLRENPFGYADMKRSARGDSVACLAGLVAERPGLGPSHLARIIRTHAERHGQSVAAAAGEWFDRYLTHVAEPVLWLDDHAGIALEAHQQNTLVLLDAHGLPCGGRYRDNQGYYFRASRQAELDRRLPGAGRASDTVVTDQTADERLTYYLGVNNLLGLIGALGSQDLAPETALLDQARELLAAYADRSGAARTLLKEPVLRCKGNLMTRLRGLDELVGPVDGQSVYVQTRNPFV